jgi:hypothetical protein
MFPAELPTERGEVVQFASVNAIQKKGIIFAAF